MGAQELQRRLNLALEKIESRIRSAEARPTQEEILALKAQREQDLQEIKEIRAQIKEILE